MIHAYACHEPKGELKPFEYDPGDLQKDAVEIDVKYCGICHSDLSVINNDWQFTQYPLVPGHEVVGVIAQVGKDVTQFKPGDAVGLGWHAGYCNTCTQCLSGDHNLCSGAQATIIGHYGGFANKVRAQATSVFKIPEGVDLKSAGPLFCGGITVFNPLVQFNISPTSSVGVIGIGGLGHLALQFLNAWGCHVTAFTSSDLKRKEALNFGAHNTLDSKNKAELEAAAGTFDYIISTVNVKLDWNTYLNTLKPKGRLHFVGATLDPLDINVFNLIMLQRSISASPVGSPSTIATMLNFVKNHNIKPIVEVFKMNQVNEALAHLEAGKAHYRIVLENES